MITDKQKYWLEQRRKSIGASDVAAVLGEDPRRGRFQLWAEKVYGYNQGDGKRLLLGRISERAIGQMYSIETGRPILGEEQNETEIQYHAEIPWLSATLDDITSGSDENPSPGEPDSIGPLELKNTSGFVYHDGVWKKIKASDWAEKAPLGYKIQNQIQMAVMGSPWGSLAALFPNVEIAWLDQIRNDRFLNICYAELEKFWELVETKTPPPLDELPGTLAVVKALYPDETGETIELDEDDEKLVVELMEIKSNLKEAEKRKAYLEAQLRYKIGDATFANCPTIDKTISLKKTYRKGYTRVVESSEFRTLRIGKKHRSNH